MVGAKGSAAAAGAIVGGLVVALLLTACATTRAHAAATSADDIISRIDIEQHLGGSLPLDARLTDAAGEPIELGELFDERPVVLALVYYECPMLCTLVLNGLVKALRTLSSNVHDEFDVVVISFDPSETSELAAAKKAAYLTAYGRPETAAGWHFLTGDEQSIERVTEAAGFRYAYDPDRGEYAHAAAVMVATPQGRLSRYLLGIEYSARDLRLALVEASEGRIGGLVDRLLLYCYRYDPARGKYSAVAMNMVRAGGVVTVAALATFMIVMRRRERSGRAGG